MQFYSGPLMHLLSGVDSGDRDVCRLAWPNGLKAIETPASYVGTPSNLLSQRLTVFFQVTRARCSSMDFKKSTDRCR
jgi:hypothetical protein